MHPWLKTLSLTAVLLLGYGLWYLYQGALPPPRSSIGSSPSETHPKSAETSRQQLRDPASIDPMKRSDAPPPDPQLEKRQRRILDALTTAPDESTRQRALTALLRHPTPEALRDTLGWMSGLPSQTRDRLLVRFQQEARPRLIEILRQLASTDTSEEIRTLARQVLLELEHGDGRSPQ